MTTIDHVLAASVHNFYVYMADWEGDVAELKATIAAVEAPSLRQGLSAIVIPPEPALDNDAEYEDWRRELEAKIADVLRQSM